MQLRTARPEDAASVVQILGASRLEYLPFAKSPHSPDEDLWWVHNKLIPTDSVMIAKLGDIDIGVLATSISDKIGWIDQLYIAPGYIGRGIGTELLNYALGILPRPARLWTFQENERAIRFYENRGFKAIEYTNGETNEEKCPDVLYEYK